VLWNICNGKVHVEIAKFISSKANCIFIIADLLACNSMKREK
jgi:hypothetical protein